jgi:ketosteroid isomerase-like protein
MKITRANIKSYLKEYEAAANSRDFARVRPLIHPEAAYRFTDGDFLGIKAIQKAFEDTWDHIRDEKYAISNIRFVHIDEKSASITYDFSSSGIVDGRKKSVMGRGTNILIKTDTGLQCILEHLSR